MFISWNFQMIAKLVRYWRNCFFPDSHNPRIFKVLSVYDNSSREKFNFQLYDGSHCATNSIHWQSQNKEVGRFLVGSRLLPVRLPNVWGIFEKGQSVTARDNLQHNRLISIHWWCEKDSLKVHECILIAFFSDDGYELSDIQTWQWSLLRKG